MTITLNVNERDTSVSTKTLRANGGVPAVVYGSKAEAVSISVNGQELDKVIKKAGESTIVELEGLGKKTDVLIKNVDFDPVKQAIVHADFFVVEAGQEITTHVHLEFTGESPVEKVGGIVNKVLQEVEITCKPKDLPEHIVVNLDSLKTLEDKITIADLNVPNGVEVNAEPTDAVVTVNEVKEEEEVPVEAVDMDAIEVEEKGKGEEGEETEVAG